MAGGNPLTRRTLCSCVGATVARAGLGARRYVGSEPLVRPPGGQDEENLVSRCVLCYRCIEACPEKVIVAASLDAGVLNMRTPRMEFSDCYPGQLDDFHARRAHIQHARIQRGSHDHLLGARLDAAVARCV